VLANQGREQSLAKVFLNLLRFIHLFHAFPQDFNLNHAERAPLSPTRKPSQNRRISAAALIASWACF